MPTLYDPGQKRAKAGEGEIGDADIRGVMEGTNLVAAEVAVALEVVPLQVIDADDHSAPWA